MGRLHASITHKVIETGGNVIARTGTNVKYAAYQEFGTGLHGPRKRKYKIRGAFGIKGLVVWHPGVKPKRYFARALVAERPVAEARLDREVRREMENS